MRLTGAGSSARARTRSGAAGPSSGAVEEGDRHGFAPHAATIPRRARAATSDTGGAPECAGGIPMDDEVSTPTAAQAHFHNVTRYVPRGQLEAAAAFYRDILGLKSAVYQLDHIACFELVGYDVALCIHEEEDGHPAGTTELVFGAADPLVIADRATSRGYERLEDEVLVNGLRLPRLSDGGGTDVRIDGHQRRSSRP